MTESDIATRADTDQTRSWKWALPAEIELLEELLIEHRSFNDADDALAGHELSLTLALSRRRHVWRTAPCT